MGTPLEHTMVRLVVLAIALTAVAAFATGDRLEDEIVPEFTDAVLTETSAGADASVHALQRQFDALQAKIKAGAKITPGVKATITSMVNMVTTAIEEAKRSDQELVDVKAKAVQGLNTQAAGQIQA